MTRVLCLIDVLGMGGAERQMVGLSLLLKEKGYNVDLITYHGHLALTEQLKSYNLSPITLHPRHSPLSKLNAVRGYIKNRGGFDWVITYKTGPNLIGCLLRLMGMRFHLIVSERNTTQVIGIKERIQFLLYRMADYVVPNSYAQGTFICGRFPWLKEKTVVITNFTNTSHFVPCDAQVNTTIIVLTVARISSQKNVLKYLDAIALIRKRNVRNIKFEWYGDVQKGEEEYGERVFRKVTELNLNEMITFHPGTTNIVKQYQSCDVFCLPSNYEGFPNVVCEAMSCGKPIVCSRTCDNPYIVKEGENALLFDNASVEDIADKILTVCSMPNDRLIQWGHRSREIAEESFSKEQFIDKYIQLLEA